MAELQGAEGEKLTCNGKGMGTALYLLVLRKSWLPLTTAGCAASTARALSWTPQDGLVNQEMGICTRFLDLLKLGVQVFDFFFFFFSPRASSHFK